MLRWAGFLKAAAKLPPPPPPSPAPISLPPPPLGTQFGKRLRLPADSAWWGVPTLNGWLKLTGAPISEEGGQQLASQAGQRAVSGGRPGFGIKTLGQRKGASDDADGRAAPSPAYLSPYLRWGVISARQADASGVRRRDLLWRDFSRAAARGDRTRLPHQPLCPTLVWLHLGQLWLHLGTAPPWYCFALVLLHLGGAFAEKLPIPLATASPHPARDSFPSRSRQACAGAPCLLYERAPPSSSPHRSTTLRGLILRAGRTRYLRARPAES